MDKHKSVLHSSAIVLGAQVFGLFASLGLNFLLARTLGPAGRGLIYLVQIISALGLTLLNFGIGPAALYYCRNPKFRRDEIVSWVLSYSLLLGVLPISLFLLGWHWAASLINHKMEPKYFLLALLGIPCMMLTWNVGHFCLGLGRVHAFNFFRVAPSSLLLIMLLLFRFAHSQDTWTVALLWLISILIPAAIALGIALQAGARWSMNHREFFTNHFQYAWHTHLAAVTQYLQYRADVLMVGIFLPVKELGQYGLAVTLGELVWNVPTAVSIILMPHIAGKSAAEANKISPIFCRLSFTITALLALLVSLSAAWFVPRYLPAFRPSVPVLWLLMPGIAVASIFKVLSSDISGRGKPLQSFYPSLVSLVLTIVAGVFLIPRYGILAAAIISSVGYLINAILYLFSFNRITRIPFNQLLIPRLDDCRALLRFKTALGSEVVEPFPLE